MHFIAKLTSDNIAGERVSIPQPRVHNIRELWIALKVDHVHVDHSAWQSSGQLMLTVKRSTLARQQADCPHRGYFYIVFTSSWADG